MNSGGVKLVLLTEASLSS